MRKKKENKKGAGKPAFFSKPMERINVMLDSETIAFYKKVGGGNLSEGIRKHWRGLTQIALDGGDSAASKQFPTPEVLSTLQGESTPAHRK